KASFWYKLAFTTNEEAAKFPNGLLIIGLVSNFGMFLLYMMTCACAMVAYHEREDHNILFHVLIPLFGLVANFLGMLFYLVGPFMIPGMSWHESYIAVGVAAAWGIYGSIYFLMRSKKLGREVMATKPPTATTA
ncbi:MAG: hypothetical protein ABSF29_16175, partial [Tepidisphaeraceae bacterium]